MRWALELLRRTTGTLAGVDRELHSGALHAGALHVAEGVHAMLSEVRRLPASSLRVVITRVTVLARGHHEGLSTYITRSTTAVAVLPTYLTLFISRVTVLFTYITRSITAVAVLSPYITLLNSGVAVLSPYIP